MRGEPIDHRNHRISATKSNGDGVDQGKLYSPNHAIKIATNPNSVESSGEEDDGGERQRTTIMLGMKNLAAIKDKVLEKLAAASVPSESLENAKQFLESVIKDFAGAAQGLTKDALHRIKTHLAVIIPSVSPAVTGKIVDDAEKEAINGEEQDERKSKETSGDEVARKLPYVSPTSSFFGSLAKPFSKL